MIRIRQGIINKILTSRPGKTEVLVIVEGSEEKAINYDDITGPVANGDKVVLNTTAIYKGLGTGGSHFIMANLANESIDITETGHIMKLRYTPGQVKCLAVEEQDSPYFDQINSFDSLDKMPVIVATLHSMLPPAVVAIKSVSKDSLKVAYIMTDGAALPIDFSNVVAELKNKGLIDASITVGNAFGGDYEAVNIYTGLIAAKEVVKADVVIVAMGPGIVGTGTKYGFTGVEQGEIINAVNILGGQPIAIPRISFADKRERHRGISHHSITVLETIALTPALITLPEMDEEKKAFIEAQLNQSKIREKHQILYEPTTEILDILQAKYKINVTTMGRNVEQDKEFFLTAAAAGITAAKLALNK